MIYFTELQHLPMYGVKGEFLGELEDLCVDPGNKGARVSSYLVRTPHKALAVHNLRANPIHLGTRWPNQCVAG